VAAQVAAPRERPPLDLATADPADLREPEAAAVPGALAPATDIGIEELDEPPSTERQAVAVLASPSVSLRGQVVDARTGQGLPFVEVAPYSIGARPQSGAPADFEGRFVLETATSPGHFVLARDRLAGKRLARRKVETLIAEGGVWRVDAGPTLIVRLHGEPAEVESWRVRLLERSSSNEEHPWSWCDVEQLDPDGALAARYRKFEREPGSGDRVWIQVEEHSATWKGEIEIDGTPGVHTVELDVGAFAATLGGRVVNDLGVPLKASVTALRQGFRRTPESPWPQTETDDEGVWQLSGLDAGPTHLLVVCDHLPTHSMNVLLERGESKQLEIVLPSVAIAGSIEGKLVAPAGGDTPVGILRLQSVDSGSTDLAQFCMPDFNLFESADAEPDTENDFAFENVPVGRYRISLLPLDGRGYAPESFLVEAPATVEFTTDQASSPSSDLEYNLVLRSATTGERLGHAVGLVHLESFWAGEVQEGDPVQALAQLGERLPISIVVGHIGYRPAVMNLPEAMRSAQRIGSRMEVDFELEPGYGAALVVLDAGHVLGGSKVDFDEVLPMGGLRGARIVSGGKVIGTSDSSGLALCKSDGPIEEFEVQLPGWSVLAVDRFRSHAETPDGLGFVLMARD
jgi:hypothetical protein